MTVSIEQLAERALDAFWEDVARCFPDVHTGDTSPLTTFNLVQAAEATIREWIDSKADPNDH